MVLSLLPIHTPRDLWCGLKQNPWPGNKSWFQSRTNKSRSKEFTVWLSEPLVCRWLTSLVELISHGTRRHVSHIEIPHRRCWDKASTDLDAHPSLQVVYEPCEFDAVNLIWMTRTNREAPCQVEPMSTSSPPFGIKLANRALEHVPCKSRCGLWVPARVSPERTSNLECGLSVGLVFTPTLHIGSGA